MATAPSYAEQQQMMDREKNLMENLMDFSFRRMVTPRMLQMLYGLHLLLGFSVAIWFVFKAFQSSTSDGLLTVILGIAALFLWIVYCRIVVELLAVIFRAGESIINSQN